MNTMYQPDILQQPTRNPALAGTLSDWSLVDVIQLIDLGKKTGAVVVYGHRDAGAIEGQIAFLEGAIHHAHNGKHSWYRGSL